MHSKNLAACPRPYFAKCVVIVLASQIAGCQVETSISANSSQGDDEYVEESLDGWEEQFEPALDTSNQFVHYFTKGHLDAAHKLFDERLSHTVSIEELGSLRQQVLDAWGPVVEFKTKQWGFSTAMESGEAVVYSTKIVVHENSGAFYILEFLNDGEFEEIRGINIRPRNRKETIDQALDSVLAGD